MTIRTMLFSVLFAACGTAAAPKVLVDAPMAHARAQEDASVTAPADLHEATRALARAEATYLDDGDSPGTRDLAYVALRKAEEASARGRMAQASADRASAEREIAALDASRRRRTERELTTARQRLGQAYAESRENARRADDERAARMEREAELGAEIDRQRQETATAENEARAAVESLREIAAVREESRGTVLTLSGSVLFATGASTLLPIARAHLDRVAEMLRDTDDRAIVVEGHTDARGSATRNEELSQLRADAVRDYLVSRGVPAQRIRAEGFGPRRPVTDNATAEGRANNRRVEIVIEPRAAR